jgi:hypothetical protein
MSFVFVRGYHDAPIAAGLRLAIIPVVLGLVAPISGALYERMGPRIPTSVGMALCVGALTLLSMALGGTIGIGLAMTAALALFGSGLGMFIAPNNSATMAAAPDNRSGEAGGLLNLMRVLGGSFGIAAVSSTLSWRLEVLSGVGNRTLAASTETLLAAANDVLLLLGALAVVAGGIALLRGQRQSEAVRP